MWHGLDPRVVRSYRSILTHRTIIVWDKVFTLTVVTFSFLDAWIHLIPLCLIAGKCPLVNKSDLGQKEDVYWKREEMFSVRGQSLVTQTRCALPRGHHLTRATLNPIIPDRLLVPRDPQLTGTEAIHMFTCHSDCSQIPELSSHHASTCHSIKPLASLCYQSLQETLFSKVYSTSYRFCLRSSQGT